jgi:2-oxoglutarate ferredoxin oxidoreductase subunit gamma
MSEHRIIISGFGGQGVLLLGKLIATAGMQEGKNVSWLPSYGPEMRGGTANCHVIVSDSLIGAPVITEATAVLAMNLPSVEKFEPLLVPGGLLVVNSSMSPHGATRPDVEDLCLPANEIAAIQGSLKVANIVMLGAFLSRATPIGTETLIASLRDMLGSGKQHLLEINLKALEAGLHHSPPLSATP